MRGHLYPIEAQHSLFLCYGISDLPSSPCFICILIWGPFQFLDVANPENLHKDSHAHRCLVHLPEDEQRHFWVTGWCLEKWHSFFLKDREVQEQQFLIWDVLPKWKSPSYFSKEAKKHEAMGFNTGGRISQAWWCHGKALMGHWKNIYNTLLGRGQW